MTPEQVHQTIKKAYILGLKTHAQAIGVQNPEVLDQTIKTASAKVDAKAQETVQKIAAAKSFIAQYCGVKL